MFLTLSLTLSYCFFFFYNKEIPVRCSDLSAHNVNIYSEGKKLSLHTCSKSF